MTSAPRGGGDANALPTCLTPDPGRACRRLPLDGARLEMIGRAWTGRYRGESPLRIPVRTGIVVKMRCMTVMLGRAPVAAASRWNALGGTGRPARRTSELSMLDSAG